MSVDERAIYDSYIQVYCAEYGELTESDRIQLEDAAAFHIQNIRYLNQPSHNWNSRYLPKSVELTILDHLALSRKQREQARKTIGTGSQVEEDLKEALLALSVPVRRT